MSECPAMSGEPQLRPGQPNGRSLSTPRFGLSGPVVWGAIWRATATDGVPGAGPSEATAKCA
eukprot:8236556-Lingulodinium_polyedra.AAC.1